MPRAHHSRKRHGKHHRHTKRYAKVYAPYLPIVLSIVASLLLSYWQPAVTARTQAYATEMSVSGLLSATNSQRVAHSVGALAVNSALNSAAQAKANDMVARNYWSHTTPEGQEPWVFIENTGYQYTKAGENLAYGFATSSAVVDGWMNSPSHKANMLDGAFSDVGFGFANSANFNGDGEQTVVVAMYATPYTLPASTPPPPPPPPAPSTTQPSPPPSEPPAETPAPQPQPEPEPVTSNPELERGSGPVTTEQPVDVAAPTSQPINRSQILTGAPWIVGVLTVLLGGAVLFKVLHVSIKLKHALKDHPKLRHALLNGERFILHHPLLDSTILSLAILSYTLSRVVGIIL